MRSSATRHVIVLAALLATLPVPGPVVGAGTPAPTEGKAPEVDFRRDIRPLLSDRCFHCHGPDRRRGRLRLDTREGAFRRAIEPGDASESELYLRIAHEDEEERMPPPDSGKSLTPEQVELFRRWIDGGAPWQEHWAFEPPARHPLPEVSRGDWPRGGIDRFILARLEAEGLQPSPEADRATLIRRLTLDLTGLPPSPEELDAFLGDQGPDAYERLVDRLLASPRYGEHMARYWLDAARYGDTHGLHLDNYRSIWPYRDWVIRAYDQNMTFDRFTIEQLAGDLLPEPTRDQLVATGFNRCNVTTSEGGAIDEEFLVRYAIDRVETTSTVWMGLTAGCAACHDHKFDPISQKEFYSLFAYFNNITEPAMDGNRAEVPPVVRVPPPGVDDRRAEIARRVRDAEARREERARTEEVAAAHRAWLDREEAAVREGREPPPPEGQLACWTLDAIPGGVTDVVAPDAPDRRGRVVGNVAAVEGRQGGGARFDGGHIVLGDVGDFEHDTAFSYAAWIRAPGNVTGAPIARMDSGARFRGWDLYLVQRKAAVHIIHSWSDRALKVTTRDDVLEPGHWHHVTAVYDGSARAAGITIYVDGQPRPVVVNNDSLGGQTIRTRVPLRLGSRSADSPFRGGSVDDVRIFGRDLSPDEVAALAGADPIRPLLARERGERSAAERRTLLEHWLRRHDASWRALDEEIAALRAEDRRLEESSVPTMIMRERGDRRIAHVLFRGEYDQPRDAVDPGVPSILPPLPADAPAHRLGLARWLVDPRHPLTARVAVNRHWQQVFGTGLVRTQEDFGSQGEPPSHPELLDWLATRFVDSGWDVKALLKTIVTSATYRQSSRTTPEHIARDPGNRLLARGPRFRLDAEALRDQALFVSGLLVERRGGPSVKPPQPGGLWYAVGYTSSNTARFRPDEGDAIYRRSVYTFWKRTAPPPAFGILDAPSRESCCVRRERTNTPLQALLLLNDRQYVEAARSLAQRTLEEVDREPWTRADRMFRRVTCRHPDAAEMALLLESLDGHLAAYGDHPEEARALIGVGDTPADAGLDAVELAAWTMVANLVLNLDEVVNKG